MQTLFNEAPRFVPTDKDTDATPRKIKVTPTPRDADKIPEPKGGPNGLKDGVEKKYSKWKLITLAGGDDRANKSGANCAGTTFAKGFAYIEMTEVQTILDDNYTFYKSPTVCCVVAWGETGNWHHAALIVDIAADGTPIVWGKDGTTDVVSEYRADEFSKDWKPYCRNKVPDSVELADLTKEYEAAKALHGAGSPEARLAAYRMCQCKNALNGI